MRHQPLDIPAPAHVAERAISCILKAELKRRNIRCSQRVGLVADQGVMDSESNIRNKISRGNFTAAFFVQCLLAIGVEQVCLN